jgi:anthraniloyl-CoA monooxygenase
MRARLTSTGAGPDGAAPRLRTGWCCRPAAPPARRVRVRRAPPPPPGWCTRAAPRSRRRRGSGRASPRSMKIVCIGGGPAGLYFALLMKKLGGPRHDITVVERNRPYDTFGWGVVFSDATMDNMRQWDRETADAIEASVQPLGRHRAALQGPRDPLGRPRLRRHRPQEAAQHPAGALRGSWASSWCSRPTPTADADYPDADLIIASDGINSRIRTRHADVFQPDIVTRPNRYIWLGTHKLYDAFTFDFREDRARLVPGPHLQVRRQHQHLHRRMPRARVAGAWPGPGRPGRIHRLLRKLFADNLQGEKLMTNARHLRGSAWLNFQRVVCGQWSLQTATAATWC